MRRLRLATAVALMAGLGLAACDRGSEDVAPGAEAQGDTAPVAETTDAPPTDSAEATPPAPATTVTVAEAGVLPGAPQFAVLYPGGEVRGDVTLGESTTGQGGMITFTTAAAPSDVVEFYRERAESSGLSSVMAMTQGETHAYGARSARSGANLSVVATPVEGETSVQLSWGTGS